MHRRLPPKKGKKYKEIVDLGCGGNRTNTSNGSDFDCDFEYPWDCDSCPVIIEEEKFLQMRKKRCL